jgi:short-subunit dehydrogenase
MTTVRRVALVTGGSSGIGAACVRKLLARGWRVSVVALPDSDLDWLAGLDILMTPGDITSQHVREAVVEQTLYRYNRIDVLINSAGVGLYACATEVPMPLFSRLLDVNVLAPLALAQMVVPVMKRQGGGSIVNIGSVGGSVALPWTAAYSASKFALDAIHDSLRRELRGDCIHFLKVCPGIVDTEFRNHVLAGAAPRAVTSIRIVVSPETVADRILSAIRQQRQTIYVPWIGRLFALGGALAPWLMDFYLARFQPAGTGLDTSVEVSLEACKYNCIGHALHETPGTAPSE